jgi:predicted nucleic acid-binding Zn ribbon protein
MTYVYKCRGCGETFEVQERITDAPLRFHWVGGERPCGAAVYRVPQVPGIVYRGAGFHTTDYTKEVRSE